MPTLVVTTDRLDYGKARYRMGDEFEASEKDAKLLIGIKKAAEAVRPSKMLEAPAEVRAAKRATEEDPAPKSVRTYQRRDMVAETHENPPPLLHKKRGRPAGTVKRF